MSDYVISCCSPADLSVETMEKYDISFARFHYQLDGKEYYDDCGQTKSIDEFYQNMRDGLETKTSQINAEEFENYFSKILEDGKDIIHVTLSSGISGVVNSAMIAKAAMEEKYPDRKIIIVDSLGASTGYGLLMVSMAIKRDEGLSIDELYEWTEANKLKVHHWFFTDDLTFFIKGGRVSKTAGFVGNMLSICPLLNVDYQGKLIPRFKVRTKKKVMMTTLEQMKQYADNGENYSGKCFISSAGVRKDAEVLAEMVSEAFPNIDGGVEIFDIGTTIGSHTGPGTVALFFFGSERID